MLDAADTIEAFNQEYGDLYTADAPWRPSELRRESVHRKRFEDTTPDDAGQLGMWGDQ
jgi:hypothetical protein